MSRMTFKDIKKLGFQIDENIHNISQFYKINLDTDTPIESFSQDVIDSDIIETNYDISETTYSISKDGNLIDTGLGVSGIIDFFESENYKKHL